MKKSAIWQFVQHRTRSGESWTWRRLRANGELIEASAPHEAFGKAVAGALLRGFEPDRQHWMTQSGNWVTHFPPGEPPYTEPTGGSAARGTKAPGAARLRKPVPASAVSAVLTARRQRATVAGGSRPAARSKPGRKRPA